jgi:hypothetical protein
VNESAVLLAGDLAWPVAVLVIATLVLATQRQPIGRLIDRIKSLKYPGGEADLSVVAEAGVAVISTAVESLSRDVTVQLEPGKRPVDGEVMEPIQNREPIGDVEPLPAEEVTNLVVLRTRAANVLEELAYPPPPGGFGTVAATLSTLHRRGVLDKEQTLALGQLIEIADEATRGAVVPLRVAQAVQNSGPAILVQLDKLRAVAAAKFEEHVLDALRQRLPHSWSLDIDRAIPRGGLADPAQFTDPGTGALVDGGHQGAVVHARVDALVTARNRHAVVEIRARLQPGADGQIEAVREWFAALPSELPVLLVMLGERLTDRELSWILGDRDGPVELLLWDRDADDLIRTLREVLDRSAVRTGLPTQRIGG